MRPNMILRLIALFLVFWSQLVFAQVNKHPRVLELEKSLSRQSLELLGGRFPGKPFLVKVIIDPLHRGEGGGQTRGNERLPYMDVAEPELVDEWDDPSLSEAYLLQRVRKILVSISVPTDLNEDELSELKATIFNNLGLLEIRDGVEINRRNWGTTQKTPWFEENSFILLAVGWSLFMLGLFALYWFGTGRLGRALKDIQIKMKDTSSPSAAALPTPSGPLLERDQAGSSGSEMTFHDPVKNREILSTGVKILEGRHFPTLEEMILLDRLGQTDPGSLGAFLSELSPPHRARVFALSQGGHWLEAMTNPGEVSPRSLEALNKCLRMQDNPSHEGLDELLISIWRLGSRIPEFFKSLSNEESFEILTRLPKTISLPVARQMYPGSWGRLLDTQVESKTLPSNNVQAWTKQAHQLMPLRDLKTLMRYRSEKDLLEFVKAAEPELEKEVYLAAGQDSLLWSIRPPFFEIFSLESEKLDRAIATIRIDDWALALFNVSRDLRRPIEEKLGEKMRFRLYELLKSFDGNPPSALSRQHVREKIGALVLSLKNETPPEQQSTTEEDEAAA